MALATDPTNTDAVISSWEKYAAANDVAKFAPDMVSDLLLPGHAFGPRASCGQYRLIGCLDDSHKNIIKKIKWSCHSRNCRVCWRNWAQQRARVVSDRLVAGVAHLAGPHVAKPRVRRVLHVAVSVPPDSRDPFTTTSGRKDLRRQARERLRRVVDGFDGGAVIDHAYRFTRGLNKAKFAPHFHFLVTGWFDMDKNTEIYKKEKGFVCKYLSALETKKDLYACVRYLLSHSSSSLGDVGDRSKTEHAVRYFGKFSYNQFRTETVLSNNVSVNDDMAGVLSSLTISPDPIRSIDAALFKVPYRYQDVECVDKTHTDQNGILDYVKDQLARSRQEFEDHMSDKLAGLQQDIKDYPAKPKSTICLACGVEVAGGKKTRCHDAGHTLYEIEEPEGYTPPEEIAANWTPPASFQIHIRLNYDNKSRLIVLILDGSEDRICELCGHVYRVVHYTGPPDPQFFSCLPDGAVTVPSDKQGMFVEWAQYLMDTAMTITDQGKIMYTPTGVPYFDPAGSWKVDWGAYTYPGVQFPDPLQGITHNHVFYSAMRADCMEHDRDFSRSVYWDCVEHCRMSTLDGGLRTKDKDGFGFGLGMYAPLLRDYLAAAGPAAGRGTRPASADPHRLQVSTQSFGLPAGQTTIE